MPGMNLERMLQKCRQDQWKVGDLDWSLPSREMSRREEETIVQLFTDMAGIERLAGALFVEQTRRVKDPVLKQIFETFVVDEVRHSHAAQMLADHYDKHHHRIYRENESLRAFFPHFVDAVRYLSDDVANVYITMGELILDVALLRSINDYVKDELSDRVMALINRDESRHIAVDYHMMEYYGSQAYHDELARRPRKGIAEEARAFWAFANVLYRSKPFNQDVFFRPMDLVDPTGRRITEAFKRFQLLRAKPGVDTLPFARFVEVMQDAYNDHFWGPIVGGLASRALGLEPRFMKLMNTEEEMRAAARKTFSELADEVLAVKTTTA
ncbi:MAG: hypothetical protein U0359_39245 [Byssovorax sp.]